MSKIRDKYQTYFIENIIPGSMPGISRGEYYSKLFGIYPPLSFEEVKEYRSKEEDEENYKKLLFSNEDVERYMYFPIRKQSSEDYEPRLVIPLSKDYKHQQNCLLTF